MVDGQNFYYVFLINSDWSFAYLLITVLITPWYAQKRVLFKINILRCSICDWKSLCSQLWWWFCIWQSLYHHSGSKATTCPSALCGDREKIFVWGINSNALNFVVGSSIQHLKRAQCPSTSLFISCCMVEQNYLRSKMKLNISCTEKPADFDWNSMLCISLFYIQFWIILWAHEAELVDSICIF